MCMCLRVYVSVGERRMMMLMVKKKQAERVDGRMEGWMDGWMN